MRSTIGSSVFRAASARQIHQRRGAAEMVVGPDHVLGLDVLARQRAHHHRVGEEDRRELLADRHDLVVRARRDLAEQRDAAEDRVDLLDLLVEPLDERFEEIELLLHEPHGHVFVTLPHAVDDLVDAIGVDRARGLGGGDEIVRHARQARRRRRSACSSRRSATMSIAFATRSASPTEVPPNLMTITAPPPGQWSAVSDQLDQSDTARAALPDY